MILPTTEGRTLEIRYVVRPDQAQSILLDRLGVDLPPRLRPPGVWRVEASGGVGKSLLRSGPTFRYKPFWEAGEFFRARRAVSSRRIRRRYVGMGGPR